MYITFIEKSLRKAARERIERGFVKVVKEQLIHKQRKMVVQRNMDK